MSNKIFAKVLKHDSVFSSVREALVILDKTENQKPANGKHFSLEELQGFVSGYIQIIESIIPDYLIVCNEESKCFDDWEVTVNQLATTLYKYGQQDVVAGNVLLVHKSLLEE